MAAVRCPARCPMCAHSCGCRYGASHLTRRHLFVPAFRRANVAARYGNVKATDEDQEMSRESEGFALILHVFAGWARPSEAGGQEHDSRVEFAYDAWRYANSID